MTAWPGSLPYKQFLGIVVTEEPAFIETSMDSGPPKARAIYSRALQKVDAPIVLTGQQKQIYDAWRRDEIGNGALPFTWEDPTTDATVTFAFRAEPVKWRCDVGGDANADRTWSANLPLRIIPT